MHASRAASHLRGRRRAREPAGHTMLACATATGPAHSNNVNGSVAPSSTMPTLI
jgi:hypothetical protein